MTLPSQNDTTGFLWHLTTRKAIPSIIENGLSTDFSASSLKAIFLSGSPMTAENYSGMKDDETTLLKIATENLDQRFLGPDNYELRELIEEDDKLSEKFGDWKNVSWQESIELCDQAAYHANIPVGGIIFPLDAMLGAIGNHDDVESMKTWMGAPLENLECKIGFMNISRIKKQIDECKSSYLEFPEDEERMMTILDKLRHGEPMLPIFVEAGDASDFVMEGRHRMVAFSEFGACEIPVVYVSRKTAPVLTRTKKPTIG